MLNKITTIILLLVINELSIPIVFSDEVATPAKKSEEAILEEIRWLQAEAIVSIATKRGIPISKAPGMVTVITAEQIKQMGFRTLSDFLRTVPGIDIYSTNLGTIETTGRGIGGSEKVKLLIDGHSVNNPWGGGFAWNFDDLVVRNIKKIEIVRGPGSALYGQNAFMAVINVITKDTEDVDGMEWAVSGGTFDTQNYNVLFGKEYRDLEISGFFDYYDSKGHSEKVERDVLFPASFSQSPGRSHNGREKTDLNLKLSYKDIEFKGKYTKKKREGHIGVGNALGDDSRIKTTYIFTELSYKFSLGEKLHIMPKLYYDQYNYDPFLEQRPDGIFAVPFPGFVLSYPDGIQGQVRNKQRTIGFENQINYDVFEGNKLTFGLQYEWIHQGDVKSSEFTFHPLTLAPLAEPQDFSSSFPFTRRATRQIWALYLQDEWNITEDIDLTVGLRHDQFTRFGGTTNPRVGVVWQFMEDVHLKLLFATAFRAPNFQEMFLINNPARLGNPNLDPEKVNTYEIGLGFNFTKRIKGNINYFYNRVRDRIILDTARTPDQFENSGGARVIGVEAELKADFGGDNYIFANYTFQDAEETRNRNRLPDAPVHKANLGANVGIGEHVNANLHTFISGPRPREDGDTRADLPSYALVNLTLIGKKFMDNFEITGSVFNLFDQGYEYPAPNNTVPTDFPQPGRSFIVELRYQF